MCLCDVESKTGHLPHLPYNFAPDVIFLLFSMNRATLMNTEHYELQLAEKVERLKTMMAPIRQWNLRYLPHQNLIIVCAQNFSMA